MNLSPVDSVPSLLTTPSDPLLPVPLLRPRLIKSSAAAHKDADFHPHDCAKLNMSGDDEKQVNSVPRVRGGVYISK